MLNQDPPQELCMPKSEEIHQGWDFLCMCPCSLVVKLRDTTQEGCPGLCNGNGRCTLDLNGWHCVCQLGWRGAGCDTSMETACGDSKDNDGDGLVDCMDPDCCLQPLCHVNPLCLGSPDPLDIIQETQAPVPQQNLQSFYDRVKFLVGRDSTHVIPGENPFDGGEYPIQARLLRASRNMSPGCPPRDVLSLLLKYYETLWDLPWVLGMACVDLRSLC
ncbi:hypothetical protein ACRRTK_009682 [Alexandromys fortis]